MPFSRPEMGGANFRSNSQLLLVLPILTGYLEHSKNRQLTPGEQLRKETHEKEHGK